MNEGEDEILGPVTLDTSGVIRSVVMVGGCSGVLLGPRTAISAGHCFWQMLTGCALPYTPTQAPAVGGPLGGITVRVAPPNSADFNHPATAVYGIESFRLMPSFMSAIGSTCCESPTNCPECTGWDASPPLQWNMVHDLVVVRLDRDVVGVTPEQGIYGVGSSFQAFGIYDFEPGDLVGKTMVAAGTSGTSANPLMRLRAFGTFDVDSVQSAQTISPFVVADNWWQCPNPWTTATFDAPGAYLNYNPQAQGAVCSFVNDSGGPTFVNAPALGGDSITGIPTGRLVGAVHTLGTMNPPNCASDARHTATWNLGYTLNVDGQGNQPAYSQNGDFIRESLTDFDDDGWVDAFDNCPVAFNPDQNNCNEAAEDAKGYERRGDACDPRPCARGWIEAGTKFVGSASGGALIQTQDGVIVKDDFLVDPRPSMPYYFGSTNSKAGAAPLAPAGVPTKYRFCQNDGPLGVLCTDPGIVENDYVDLPDDEIGSDDPYLRMHVKEPGAPGGTYFDESLDYDGQSQVARRWSYQADKNTWTSPVNEWISTTGGPGIWGTTSGLEGALLIHSDTDVGRFSAGSATGYRVSLTGTTGGDEDLANHLQPYAPDKAFGVISLGAWTPWPYFEWIKPWDPWDGVDPGWDGVRQEASTVIQAYEGRFARILRTGEAIAVDSELGAGLKSLMQSSAVWGPAAEASLGQAYKGPHEAPHAIAFKADGTDVFDGAWLEGGLRGNATDLSEPSLARAGGPSARSGFTPVYSRADDLAFVTGGVSGGSPTGEIWFRSVVETSVPWTRLELAGGYAPAYVVAATWSFREHKLWVLDHDGAGTARLARVHPTSGHVDVLVEADWTGDFDRHWLRLALDGRVLLFASSASEDVHGAALFDYVPMSTRSPVTIEALQIDDHPLLYRPNVDPRGMTFVTDDRGRVVVVRQDGVEGSSAALGDLRALL